MPFSLSRHSRPRSGIQCLFFSLELGGERLWILAFARMTKVGIFVSMAVLELFDLCHRNTCHGWQRCLPCYISSNVSFVHFVENCTICTFYNLSYVLYNMYTL